MTLSQLTGSGLLPPLQPWQAALGLAALLLLLYGVSRVQAARASEDFANAYFYSPSQKSRHRQRRQRWQDWSRALMAGSVFSCLLAAALYLRGPR